MTKYMLTPEEFFKLHEELFGEGSGTCCEIDDTDLCYRVAKAQLSKVLKLQAEEMPEAVRIKLANMICHFATISQKGEFKSSVEFMEEILITIRPLIEQAKDEADSKWVAALKKFNILVDSPESLAASVEILIEQAKREGRERIVKLLTVKDWFGEKLTANEKLKALNWIRDGGSLQDKENSDGR